MPAAAHAQEDLSFELEPSSRFLSGATVRGLPPADLARRVESVPIRIKPQPAACAELAIWRIDDRVMDPADREYPCPFDIRLPASKRTELRLAVADDAVMEAPRPDDLLVVALGDGIAAGAGIRPARRQPGSQGCRTSIDAGFEQAARLLAQIDPDRTITFVNLACAGATINGDLRPSPERKGPRSQLERLDALLTASDRHADAVLVSIGAADLGFASLVRHCRRRPDCSRSATNRKALAKLPRRLDGLAADFEAMQDRVAPDGIIVAEYADPTRQASGRVCERSHSGARTITRTELRWAADTLLSPLNKELAAAAERNGWRLAGGIASDFRTHGICTAAGQRWVSDSLLPNRRGQLGIANRVGAELGDVLGLVEPAPEPESSTAIPWFYIALTVGIAVLILLIALNRSWRRRIGWLAWAGKEPTAADEREADREEQVDEEQPPQVASDGLKDLAQLASKAASLVGSAVFTLTFVAAAGAAIVWVRFWAARYPADQAVRAVSREELLVIGGQAIGVFACLAITAVVVMWILDHRGTHGRRTRLALSVLVFAELIGAGVLGDYTARQRVQLMIAFAIGAALLLYLLEAGQRQAAVLAKEQAGTPAWRIVRDCYLEKPTPWRGPLTYVRAFVLQAVPLLLLAGAMIASTQLTNAPDRTVFVLLPIAVAAVLFVAPHAIAGDADQRYAESLGPVRVALSTALVFSLMAFLVIDEVWLAVATAAAVFLAAVCLAVAKASKTRFLPLGITVFFTVCAYGAIVSCVRVIDSPLAQPVAVLLKDERVVCGLWVGESDDRVWYANLQLSERGAGRRPAPRRSALRSAARDDVVDVALGPLQPVGRAQGQAIVLRDDLARQNGVPQDRVPTCGPPPARPQRPVQSRRRELAQSVQPELVVDREDGFWPIPVRSIFAMEDRRTRICRQVEDDSCVRLTSQSELTFNGGEGEWLDYPADEVETGDQRRVMVDALGSNDPLRTAREYFLVTRGRGKNAPWTVQFWFFYSFNYLDTGFTGVTHRAGFHEGDFENIGFLLSARTHQPRYVWMARHKDEGRVFVWDEDTLEKIGGGLRVYAATGSHATYESCWRQARVQAPLGLIDDRPQCDPAQSLHLSPESTPLIDLSRVPWACWRGRFGAQKGKDVGQRLPFESDDGPRGPLWQQTFGGVTSEPCRGVRANPLGADRRQLAGGPPVDTRDDEVLRERVARQLRARAGRLDPLVDNCADWEQRPTSGTLLVACDPRRLQKFVTSGLENPGSGGLRIDVVAPTRPRTGPVTVPAVRRDPKVLGFDAWRITTTRATEARIYAACQSGDGLLEARFAEVGIEPGVPLRVDDRSTQGWRLVRPDGTEVGDPVEPSVAKALDDRRAPTTCRA